ncbi:hypothetical protein PINS_up007549 [Pythium insidiosum]|nr:hypothetical protein PINS_up007549 [Pythium insidiosum]
MLEDYAKRFAECLNSSSTDDYFFSLSAPDKADKRLLELGLVMRVSTFVATLKYRFGMLPVPLERMDLLEAIVRDHGEAIRAGAMHCSCISRLLNAHRLGIS